MEVVFIYLNYKYVEQDCVLYTVIGLEVAKSVNDHICFNNTLALHCLRNSSTANQKQEQRLCYGISAAKQTADQSKHQDKKGKLFEGIRLTVFSLIILVLLKEGVDVFVFVVYL